MTPRAKSFPSAGKRLAAAMISFRLGYTGVDRVLRRYKNGPLDAWWEKKAQQILREMLRKADFQPPTQTPRL